ncbi:hypothetical protein ACH47Z_19005 [Streptomyces sp. NPDC020192]|uniref:hypothetical protein n=1 Tax=Streptomyces sp. NPDC020192 TaxID=3365066 RepID=UPI0037A238D0
MSYEKAYWAPSGSAEGGRAQQQRGGVGEAAFHACLQQAVARSERAAEDHAVLGGLVDLVQAEAVLQTRRHLQRLGHGGVDGDRLDAAERDAGKGTSDDVGHHGGDPDAYRGAELDDRVRCRCRRPGGDARGHDGQRHTTRDHGRVDGYPRPELVDRVVDAVGELVQAVGHVPRGLREVTQPAAVLVGGVTAPELAERLDGLTRVVVDDPGRAAVHGGADVIHRVGERTPGFGRVPQFVGVGLGPPQAHVEKDVAGFGLNAHRHRRSAWGSLFR